MKILLIIFLPLLLVACSVNSMPTAIQAQSNPETASLLSATETSNKPNSDKKILIQNGRDYYMSNPDGSAPILLYSGEQDPIESASLSPDNLQFAYYKGNFVYIQDIQIQKNIKLNEIIVGSLGGYMRWSPDQQKIVFTCSTPTEQPSFAVCLIDTQNRAIEYLIDESNTDEFCSANTINFLDWSDDGSTIIYSCFAISQQGQKQPISVYRYDVTSKTTKKIFDNSSQDTIWNLVSVSISPDKDNLLLTASDQDYNLQVFIYSLTINEIKQLTSETEYSFQAQAWHNNESFYLQKTPDQPSYDSSNYIMDINGEILSTLNIDGLIIK